MEPWELAKEQLAGVIAELKAKILGTNWGGGVGAILAKLVVIIPAVVKLVESGAAAIGGLTGEQKRKLAVNVINELVDVPVMPEWMEATAIGWVVDSIVAWWNKNGTEGWPAKS